MVTKNSGRTQQLKNSDEALWRQVKAAAALEGTTLTKWVEKVAREKLNLKPE
jgi:hypothetical protein